MVFFEWRLGAARSGAASLDLSDACYALVCAFAGALGELGDLSFTRRGSWPGHLVVSHRPSAPRQPAYPYAILELTNATVAVSGFLRGPLGAHARPQLPLGEHELGYTAGPDYGDFGFALAHAQILENWANEQAFARCIADHVPRRSQGGTIPRLGDYA